MTGVSNAQLASAVNAIVSAANARDGQLAAWQAGTATGGPNGDGRYPLTSYTGTTILVASPARLEALVATLVNGADGAKAETESLRDEVLQALATVELRTTQAGGHASAAATSKTQADTFRQQAASSEANALVHRNAAAASATGAASSATLAEDRADAADAAATAAASSATAASTSANNAAASAALAATFNPTEYYKTPQVDTLLAAKLSVADFAWGTLPGKPTTFAPSAHSHNIADVTGLQAALDGKQAAGSYAAASHAHAIADVTGLQSALDGKQPVGSYLTGITSGMVTTALGYTPYNSSNPSGYISGITSGMVTAALGYTPANKAGDTFTGLVTVSGAGLNAAVRLSNTIGGRDLRVTQKDDGRFVITDETAGAERFAINSSGSVTAFTDLRAPILYDSNNTGYYVDPASTSALARVQVDTLVTNGQSPAISFKGDIDGAKWFQKLGGYNLSFMNDSGAGFDSATFDGRTYYNKFYLTNSGSAIAYGDVRAPIFYDSDNTAFYANPAGTSVMNTLALGGQGSAPQGAIWSGGNIWMVGDGRKLAFSTDGSPDDGGNVSIFAWGNDFRINNWSGSSLNDNFWVFGASRDAACAGNFTAYYSDERLKTRTGPLANALHRVASLEGFTYVENEVARSVGYANSKPQVGLSAQQVQAVLPEAVSLAPFDYDVKEDGTIVSKSGENYLTVDYSRLVPLLIEAIKELKAEVDDLKAQGN